MNAGTLFGIFIHPGATARVLRDRPTWVIALLIGCLITAVIGWSVIGISKIETAERMRDSRFGKMMPPEALQKMEDDARNITTGGRVMGGIVVPAISFALLQCLIYATILHWTARAMGGTGSFRGTLALVTHARLISALAGLVALPIILAKQSVFSVSLSLAALFPSLGPGNLAYGLLSILSIFGIWMLYVLATGIREIHGLSTNLAWITAGIPWLAAGLMQAVQIAMF